MTTQTPETLRRIDCAHHLHPFTDHAAMHTTGTHLIAGAEGCSVIEADGRRLLDGLAGLWCVNVGYNRPEIAAAVARQMEKLCYYPSFFNTTTEPAVELAGKLASLAPAGMTHTVFSNSGSEANETNLKIIRNFWHLRGKPEKRKILSRTFAYHGVTLATTSLTGLPACLTPFDLPLEGFVHVPGPYHFGALASGFFETHGLMSAEQYGTWCLEQTEATIEREGADSIAAIFVEPIQGAGGVIIPPPGYLKNLRALARQHDILFVADEVISGFGRMGAWFASTLWDLEPDLISLAKGITSGYLPLGASMVSSRIADELISGGYFAHGFTYSGHPVACAAALANLAILERENLVERVASDIGPYFESSMLALASHPTVAEARCFKLIGALELVPPGGLAALSSHPTLGARAAALIREEGAIVRGIRNLIAVAPPLIISQAETDALMAAIQRGLDKLWSSL